MPQWLSYVAHAVCPASTAAAAATIIQAAVTAAGVRGRCWGRLGSGWVAGLSGGGSMLWPSLRSGAVPWLGMATSMSGNLSAASWLNVVFVASAVSGRPGVFHL